MERIRSLSAEAEGDRYEVLSRGGEEVGKTTRGDREAAPPRAFPADRLRTVRYRSWSRQHEEVRGEAGSWLLPTFFVLLEIAFLECFSDNDDVPFRHFHRPPEHPPKQKIKSPFARIGIDRTTHPTHKRNN